MSPGFTHIAIIAGTQVYKRTKKEADNRLSTTLTSIDCVGPVHQIVHIAGVCPKLNPPIRKVAANHRGVALQPLKGYPLFRKERFSIFVR